MSEREPIHEPTLPLFEDEADWLHHAAERFEGSNAEEILTWALERFHPKMAISAAGGVDGMAIIDMAWHINPDVRVFTLDTGRLPSETYQLFEDVRDAVFVTTRVGEIVDGNGSALELFQCHRDGIVGMDLRRRLLFRPDAPKTKRVCFNLLKQVCSSQPSLNS